MRAYYGVYGHNGMGVYTKWEKAKNQRIFVHGYKVKKFYNRQEAVDYAKNGYYSIADDPKYIAYTRNNWFHRC